jgi:FtsZ-interacting cell division protein ZipA
MSELQISLLGIGIAAVLAVYLYNWWQQRQYRRKFGAAFKHRHEDALYYSAVENPKEEFPDESVVHASPVNAEPVQAEPVKVASSIGTQRGFLADAVCALPDENTDYIAVVTPPTPIGANSLTLLWQQRFDFGKSIYVCGLSAMNGEWVKVIADSPAAYTSFKLALQLVNRSGAVSEAKLTDFRELARMIATQIQADVSLPDVAAAAVRAVELDKFCAAVDLIIGLNVLPGDEQILSGSDIARVAGRLGLCLQPDGAFHMIDAHGHSLFSLSNEDNTPFQHHSLDQLRVDGLTLLLDVPRVEQPALVFDQMIMFARRLAAELKASIVDANHVVLSESGLALIRDRINAVEAEMRNGQFMAGSAQARRLFS